MVNQPIGNHGLGIFWCGEIEVWDGKPTYRKSWAGNLLVW